MGQVTVQNSVTLDGVMQAPGRPDEDRRGGFEHGGWAIPFNDNVMGQWIASGMSSGPALLLGRRTYEDFASYWPKQKDNPFTEVLNKTTKYVASRTLGEPLPWRNSALLAGDAADAIAALKATTDDDFTVLGSGQLLQSLMQRDLVDEYRLLIHPLVLGSGTRMFSGDTSVGALELVDATTTSKGVVLATYRPADAP